MSELPTLALHYRPDLHLLAARWQAEQSTPDRLRAEYAELLLLGHQHQSVRWLLDVRRRPVYSVSVAAWVVEQWLPRVAAELAPRRARVAYLVAPVRQQAILDDTELGRVVTEATKPAQAYDLAVFSDEGEAMRWLLA